MIPGYPVTVELAASCLEQMKLGALGAWQRIWPHTEFPLTFGLPIFETNRGSQH